MNKRTLTDRQMAIVELIAERKKAGVDTVSLDEITTRVERWGLSAHRNSLIVSMNILIERMTAQGIFIEKVDQLGRGARQLYRIRCG